MSDEFARRADQIVADLEQLTRQQPYDGFEALALLVDQGELTWEQVFAIERDLGAVAVLATYDVNPAIQGSEIRRLERSIDGAAAGEGGDG